jgi:steroid 5-alpha reductase family enzyme
VSIPLILLIAAAISWAGSQHGFRVGGVPLFALCGIVAFAINWLVFLPSYAFQTERYFDLTGSLTYASLVVLALALQGEPDPRALLLGGLVLVWALRLGSFLFARIRRDGSDGRFDALKPSLPRFFMTWTLQGLWVLLTASCALAAMTSSRPLPLGGFAAAGGLIWVAGFAIEVLADHQKRRFRSNPANEGRFIQSGAWAWSRHPNYFGEIALWTGVAIIALPVLSGWQYATLVSPIFVYVLLTRVSGIPLLEARAKKNWGEDPEYQAYVDRTPVLVPRPPQSL